MLFEVIGESVQGALHQQAGRECQDAIDWTIVGHSSILAVADGHGSEKSPESATGAKLAVKTAISVLKDFLLMSKSTSLSVCKQFAEELLPKLMVKEWRSAVEKEEIRQRKIISEVGENAQFVKHVERDREENEFFIRYGSTLSAVLASGEFVLLFQIGDGDILLVETNGTVSHPIPKNERLIGDDTTSICLPNAWEDADVVFRAAGPHAPSLILISTDGYSNSFENEEGFFKTAPEYLELIQSMGIYYAESYLEEWLLETTCKGSGDDISLGIIWNKSRKGMATVNKERIQR